ncbi:MAG: glycosyltransferase family 4 protein [Candidatus Daviesbacteria bacterium]|nr:glycosyltransferase family 4 protein [Candidatus Daviesbacteria bacterium]
MKVAIYSPYLDTFGGGEKYMMTIAEILSAGNHVDVLLDQHLRDLGADYLKGILSERFDLDLQKTGFITAPLGKNSSAILRVLFLKKYDLLFYLTDGSIFYPTAKKNILHIQSPLIGETNNLRRKIKLSGWDLIIYNSQFTKDHSERNWPVKSQIIYPPVDTAKIKPLKKEKYILSVGRFFGYLKDKKHPVMIKVFKDLYKSGKINDWSLHLAGSASEGDQPYLEELKKSAKGLPVFFYPNIEHDNLIRLYGESAIYWHASGYGEDDPTKMEHFGISTVEAMAGGCVPVVIKKGGQIEIIEDGRSGYLWETLDVLNKVTLKLIINESLRKQMGKESALRAKHFSKENFQDKVFEIIKD